MSSAKSRLIFAVIVGMILSVGSAVLGQHSETSSHIGIKAGISVPNLIGEANEEITRDYKSRVASTFGGYVDLGISRHFSVQAEVDYAMQGGRRNGIQPITGAVPGLPTLPPGSYFFADYKNTAKLNYLEFPILFKIRWKRPSKYGFYVDGGPYFGYLLKATTVTRGSSTIYVDKNRTPLLVPPLGQPLPPLSFNADTDVTPSLHRFNFGFTGGGGITFPSDGNYFFVDARASYGLSTLQKNTATDGTSRTGNLVISLGYAFKIKGK